MVRCWIILWIHIHSTRRSFCICFVRFGLLVEGKSDASNATFKLLPNVSYYNSFSARNSLRSSQKSKRVKSLTLSAAWFKLWVPLRLPLTIGTHQNFMHVSSLAFFLVIAATAPPSAVYKLIPHRTVNSLLTPRKILWQCRLLSILIQTPPGSLPSKLSAQIPSRTK